MSLELNRDSLTGLLTRTSFEEQFRDLMQAALESDRPISLAFLDIDHFLEINNQFGHAGGDQVLKTIAGLLRTQTGDQAILGRYGGDEFAILFPDTEREQAFLTLESVRARLEQLEQFGELRTQLTITGGIASCPVDGSTENEILRKADQALYRAKVSGRNQIRLAYEEKMAPKTSHYTLTQLERLSNLAKAEGVGEAVLLREALDDLLLKYGVNPIES